LPPSSLFRNKRGIALKCRRLEDNNLEIAPIKPKGLVWVGVNDVNNVEEAAAGFRTTIAKIIRHAKSYKGKRHHDGAPKRSYFPLVEGGRGREEVVVVLYHLWFKSNHTYI
jgi:hypothetical protein